MKGSNPLFNPHIPTKYNHPEKLEPGHSSLAYLRTFATNAGSNYVASKANTHTHIPSNSTLRFTQVPSTANTYSQPKYSPLSQPRSYVHDEQATHNFGNKKPSPNLLSVPTSSEPITTLNNLTESASFADIDIGESLEKISHQIPLQERTHVSFPSGNNRSPSPINNPTQTSLGDIPYYVGSKGSPLTKAGGKYDFVNSPYHSSGATVGDKEDLTSPKSPFRVRNYSEPMKGISPYEKGSKEERGGGLMKIIPLTDRKKEAFMHPKILSNVLQFLNSGDLTRFKSLYFEYRNNNIYKKVFQRRLEKLLIKNLSNEEQYNFWNAVVDFKKVRHEHQFAFTQQFVRKCDNIRDITYDLDRTFPDYEKFSTPQGKDSLLKVLVAIANTVKEVGYIQGMNSVAAVFLFYLKEEESFWILLYFMTIMKTKDIWNADFKRVSILNYQLEVFVANYLPAITRHFEVESVSLSCISMQWFLTLYSYYLDVPVIVKLWNYVFVRGLSFLIQFGLAILSRYQDELLMMAADEIIPYLQDQLRQINKSEESIFMLALSFKVTHKLMNQLEHYHANGAPKLRISFGLDGKRKFETIPVEIISPMYERRLSRPNVPIISLESKNTSGTGATFTPEKPHRLSLNKEPEAKNTPRPVTPRDKSPIFQRASQNFKLDLSDQMQSIFTRQRINTDSSQTDISPRIGSQQISHREPTKATPAVRPIFSRLEADLYARSDSKETPLKYEPNNNSVSSDSKRTRNEKYENLLKNIVFQKPLTGSETGSLGSKYTSRKGKPSKNDNSVASTEISQASPLLGPVRQLGTSYSILQNRKSSAHTISPSFYFDEAKSLHSMTSKPIEHVKGDTLAHMTPDVSKDRLNSRSYMKTFGNPSLGQSSGQESSNHGDLEYSYKKAWFEGQLNKERYHGS